MELTLKSLNRRTKKAIKMDFYWYNPVDRIMYHGVGGRMEYVYDKQYKVSFPKVVQEDGVVYENSLPDIKKWISQNIDRFDLEVVLDGRNITIDFNIPNWNDVISSLIENKIVFEYDEKQFKKEVKDFEKSLRNSNVKS